MKKILFFSSLIILCGLTLAATPAHAMTQGECESFVQSSCELSCGTGSIGQQCTSEVQGVQCGYPMYQSMTEAQINSGVGSFYNSYTDQCVAGANNQIFVYITECNTYCNALCALECPQDAANCIDACNPSMCDTAWDQHTDYSVFDDVFIGSWITPNNACGGAGLASCDPNTEDCQANESDCNITCDQACENNLPDSMACPGDCYEYNCEDGAWEFNSDDDIFGWAETEVDIIEVEEYIESVGTAGGTIGEGTTASATLDNPITASSVPEIVVNIIQVLLTLLGSAALLIFIYGGIMMITSAGNEERLKKARATLIWAILGLVIILVSYSVMSFVFGMFGGE